MPIALVAPGDPIPVDRNEPIKRGRGRPPGSKNRPKNSEPHVVEPAAPPSPAAPPPEPEPEPSESESSEPESAAKMQEPPTPRRVKRPQFEPEPQSTRKPPRGRKPRAPPQRPETPPESPRAAKSRLWGEYREARVSAHAQRREVNTSPASSIVS